MDFVHRLVIALPLAVAGTSLLSLYPTLPCDPDAEDGGIVLPLKPAGGSGGYGVVPDEEEEEELDSDDEELVAREEKTLDPFDFRADSLVTDGYPVDEQGFWRKTTFLKSTYLLLLLFPTLNNLFSLGYYLSTSPHVWSTTLILSLPIPSHLYLLLLGLAWIGQKNVPQHWAVTIHQAVLLSILWICQAIFVVLPDKSSSSGTPGGTHNNDYFSPAEGTEGEMRVVQFCIALQPVILLPALILLVAFVRRGPELHFPLKELYTAKVYSQLEEHYAEQEKHHVNAGRDHHLPAPPAPLDPNVPNVSGESSCTLLSYVLFLYAEPLMRKGKTATSFNIWDLPVMRRNMRALYSFKHMRAIYGDTRKLRRKSPRPGLLGWADGLPPGYALLAKVFLANTPLFIALTLLATITAGMYYIPAIFLREFIAYLEDNPGPDREDQRYGWIWIAGLFGSNAVMYLTIGILWNVASTSLQNRIKLQLSTLLFSKTLVKKDLASSSKKTDKAGAAEEEGKAVALELDAQGEAARGVGEEGENKDKETNMKLAGGQGAEGDDEDDDVSSKSQIMTLFTVDVDRVADFTFHTFSLIDAPIEMFVGSFFLYKLLGVSALVGLAASVVSLPVNHFTSKLVINTQDGLMNARDERTGLMNEILGAIRMIKFMAWERKFEERVEEVRKKELKYLRRNYIIEVSMNWLWAITPVLVTVVTFFHYVIIAKKSLTPAIVFPSVSVLKELSFSLSVLPETAISVLQGFVSLRRIEKYLSQAEITPGDDSEDNTVAMRSATVTWPRDVASGSSTGFTSVTPSGANTPKSGFTLADVNVEFPIGKLSVICGRLGSGKTLMLLGLLGEADVLAGQVIAPRSPPHALAEYGGKVQANKWILPGRTAFASQVTWLQNASIRQNIIFGAPDDEERFQKVLKACSLAPDLKILEDGEDTEVGEKGLNLSGGQKARVSLARAVYSRASTLLLDDIISALDAHTTQAIVTDCFQGELMRDRTVILVSHSIKVLAPAASYVVLLDNGDVKFTGDTGAFVSGGHMDELDEPVDPSSPENEKTLIDLGDDKEAQAGPSTNVTDSETTTLADPKTEEDSGQPPAVVERKTPRKLVEDEVRQTGTIAWKTWKTYLAAQGSWTYWIVFSIAVLIGATPPVWENYILNRWSDSYSHPKDSPSPAYFFTIYAIATLAGTLVSQMRFGFLYYGSLQASQKIHKTMLERVLFATVRFHDTSVRGRTLNRFGKDIEGLDSNTADSFGRTLFYLLNVITTFASITWVGGWRFALASIVLIVLYRQAGSLYGQTSRDLRRLDSVTRSPLYATFSEVIAGVQTIRAFGGSTSMLQLMTQIADSNIACSVWNWLLSRWISARFNLLSSAIVGMTAVVVLITPTSASLAGFALSFALSVSMDILFVARRYVQLQQALVAVERLNEYCELPIEGPEHIKGTPPASWPQEGAIEIKDLVIKYAPQLPSVLHQISFDVKPGEKVGIVGATGCGKSTLALSLFRFVEPTEGSIKIDGIDITRVGLTDLRSRVTIIPQDPSILSLRGTLRSVLDVFEEKEDAEIYEALRRVHLLQPETEETAVAEAESRNKNVFRDLDNKVSEGGDNFSQGEKQLICMARAILRANKVLVMDEATASIDYETDELISKTIREEFAQSTLLTIAHRLSTIIDYDRILLLDKGNILEYDSPWTLLQDKNSKFYSLCKASGRAEFEKLLETAERAHKSER